jgi:prepilin-type N-terminal cleavage/methylation domain-containing protein
MKLNRGFTIVEMATVILILGIIAAIAYSSYQKTVAQNQLQKATSNLYTELCSLRPIAQKYDAKVMVRFLTASSQCSIYVDTSNNSATEPAEGLRVHKISSPVSIGIPSSGGPSAGPGDIMFDATGISDTWKTSVMTVNNDALGSISSGAIYLKTTRLPKITYCIGISATMHSLKIYKWEGSSWFAL